jgi:hypothetical protein
MLKKSLKNLIKKNLVKGTPAYSFARILIKNGTIVNADGKFKGDVLINDTKIEKIL